LKKYTTACLILYQFFTAIGAGDMSLTVYAISGSPCVWRVLLGLTLKRIKYNVHSLKLSENEHKSAGYLSINPRGTVPSVVTNRLVIKDSIAILAWLDRAYPERPLFGETPDEAAIIWQATMENNDYLRDVNNLLLTPVLLQGVEQKTENIKIAANNMHIELQRLESLLTHQYFIAGDKPSAADTICYPEVQLLKRAIHTHLPLMAALGFQAEIVDFPRLVAWEKRLETLKGIRQTMPPHWV